jgi:hypothetical protein
VRDREQAIVNLKRSPYFETLADLGNGVKLESYFPDRNPEPTLWLRQTGGPAPIKRAQIRPLIEALERIEAALNPE